MDSSGSVHGRAVGRPIRRLILRSITFCTRLCSTLDVFFIGGRDEGFLCFPHGPWPMVDGFPLLTTAVAVSPSGAVEAVLLLFLLLSLWVSQETLPPPPGILSLPLFFSLSISSRRWYVLARHPKRLWAGSYFVVFLGMVWCWSRCAATGLSEVSGWW